MITDGALLTLAKFPKIKYMVETYWGTVTLKEYLDNLMADSYDGDRQRQGFPSDVSDVIIKLSLENQEYLESIGISFEEDPASQFALVGWELPPNF